MVYNVNLSLYNFSNYATDCRDVKSQGDLTRWELHRLDDVGFDTSVSLIYISWVKTHRPSNGEIAMDNTS